jgi:hypothetical protein
MWSSMYGICMMRALPKFLRSRSAKKTENTEVMLEKSISKNVNVTLQYTSSCSKVVHSSSSSSSSSSLISYR